MTKHLLPVFSIVACLHAVDISPVLENIVDNCDGTFTAWYGYSNPSNSEVSVSVGSLNYFTGGALADLGQPTTFLPGRQVNVFAVDLGGNSELVWKLTDHTATANSSKADNACGVQPIRPFVDTVVNNCDGTFSAVFGYSNGNSSTVEVPHGDGNKITGIALSSSPQPSRFLPGRHPSAFTIPFSNETIVWTLNGRTATAANDQAQQPCVYVPINPVLEKVVDSCNGSYTAVFGYLNVNSHPVVIPHGAENILVGQTQQPQPTTFEPGRHYSVFRFEFDGSNLVWHLDSSTATASSAGASNTCDGSVVKPVVESVRDNCDNTYTAFFGYANTGMTNVLIPLGDRNKFTGLDQMDLGQTTVFEPGRHKNVFTVEFPGSNLVWTLGGRTATAASNQAPPTCPREPLSPVVDSIVDNCDDTYTAWFGYENLNEDTVRVPVGPPNSFHGLPEQPQITILAPGRKRNAFSVTWPGHNIVWTLTGRTATAHGDKAANTCACVEPGIIDHPLSQTTHPGETVIFTVLTEGTDNRFQWRRNDQVLQEETSHSLAVGPVSRANHLDEYRVLIENDCGRSILSKIGLLRVVQKGECPILAHPHADSVELGVPFVASVTTACTPDSYQWLKNGVPIPGASSRSLTTPPVTWEDNKSAFSCVISAGMFTDTSEIAILTVIRAKPGVNALSISGKLYDGSSNPIGDSYPEAVQFRARFYAAMSDTEAVYEEFLTGPRGLVENGEFNLRLGSNSHDASLQKICAAHANLYVEIHARRDGYWELVAPRFLLTAAPYAHNTALNVLYNRGSPANEPIFAAIGTYYIDKADSSTWIKTDKKWIKLD